MLIVPSWPLAWSAPGRAWRRWTWAAWGGEDVDVLLAVAQADEVGVVEGELEARDLLEELEHEARALEVGVDVGLDGELHARVLRHPHERLERGGGLAQRLRAALAG